LLPGPSIVWPGQQRFPISRAVCIRRLFSRIVRSVELIGFELNPGHADQRIRPLQSASDRLFEVREDFFRLAPNQHEQLAGEPLDDWIAGTGSTGCRQPSLKGEQPVVKFRELCFRRRKCLRRGVVPPSPGERSRF